MSIIIIYSDIAERTRRQSHKVEIAFFMNKQTLEKILLLILYSLAFFALVRYNLINHNPESQFEILAKSFLNGHLYLGINDGKWLDASYYKGYAYWPQGMFPAIVLMPLVGVFGNLIHQQHIHF